MGRTWIEDDKRPGGIGRSERERIFWERVASGRKPAAVRGLRRSRRKTTDPTARLSAAAGDAPGASGSSSAPGISVYTPSDTRLDTPPNSAPDSAAVQLAESLEMAIVTMLTVVVFGLGWATLETQRFAPENDSNLVNLDHLEGVPAETGYALPASAIEETDRD